MGKKTPPAARPWPATAILLAPLSDEEQREIERAEREAQWKRMELEMDAELGRRCREAQREFDAGTGRATDRALNAVRRMGWKLRGDELKVFEAMELLGRYIHAFEQSRRHADALEMIGQANGVKSDTVAKWIHSARRLLNKRLKAREDPSMRELVQQTSGVPRQC